jgi:hypothetical protein
MSEIDIAADAGDDQAATHGHQFSQASKRGATHSYIWFHSGAQFNSPSTTPVAVLRMTAVVIHARRPTLCFIVAGTV